jgi:hypothetical protein
MFCSIKSPAVRRLTNRVLGTMVLNILFTVIAALGIRFGHLGGIPAYLLAVFTALPIIGAIVAFGLLGGIGGTLAATTVWGNLEAFAHVPHLQAIWIYPIFWLFVGLSIPVVLLRYR